MRSKPLLPELQQPKRSVQLVCFPHAGGGAAAYFRWRKLVPDWLDVTPIQLPGREARIQEPLYATISELVQDVADALAPFSDRPFALLGNSMGALVAFELARELRRRELLLPKLLVVAACRAPQLMNPPAKPLAELDDEQFIKVVNVRFGEIPEEVIQNQGLMQLCLPALRADVAMLEAYLYQPGAPLDMEILALGGNIDASLPLTGLTAWQEQTNDRFSARSVHGGHLFLTELSTKSPPAALKIILKRLQQYR